MDGFELKYFKNNFYYYFEFLTQKQQTQTSKHSVHVQDLLEPKFPIAGRPAALVLHRQRHSPWVPLQQGQNCAQKV